MDKNAIKKYAVWARRELISRVTQKALQYGITEKEMQPADASSVNGVVLSAKEKKQRQALIAKINTEGFEQVMEEVAYTWFNRFSALRFMEVNGYLPTHVRVFTDEENSFKPQILSEAINLEIEGLDMENVYALKEANDNDALFKYLIITQCNALNAILPEMFQKIDDYTELLFPDNLLREGSAIEQMIAMIPEEDWQDAVQIIGWLYQYYNSEPKDKVFADLKKNIKITKENIPAATQLFTPDWTVRYMVENSLGRLWLEGHPQNEKELLPMEEEQAAYVAGDRNTEDSKWHYYLKEAEQEADVQVQLAEIRKEYSALKPEDILCIDPCMGSGHIIVYMFDALMKIYAAYGYSTRESVQSIIEHNLYGLDIDDRAAQLAYFAVMMKAVQYDNRFLKRSDIPQPHVYSIKESNHLDSFAVKYFCNGDKKLTSAMHTLMEEMHDATEYGSILNITQVDFALLYARFEEIKNDISMYREVALNELLPFVHVAETLAQKYRVVVTNPPYMGASGMSAKLSDYVKTNYPDSKSDLFAVFMERCGQMVKKNCYQAMITQHAWMFLSSFEKLRNKLLSLDTVNMAHLGARAFEEIGGEVVQTTSFVLRKSHIRGCKGVYFRLIEPTTQKGKENMFLAEENRYESAQNNFSKIPGSPIAYWVSEKIIDSFNNTSLYAHSVSPSQNVTGDNGRFVRKHWELEKSKIGDKDNWIFYAKGGGYRKWWGNLDDVVNWTPQAREIYQYGDGKHASQIINREYWYKKGITWGLITSAQPSFRIMPEGATYDKGGSTIIVDDDVYCFSLGLLNTKIYKTIASMFNPTLNFQVKDVRSMPLILERERQINEIVDENVSFSKSDWDSFETSWDFKKHPLIRCSSIAEAYTQWERECNDRFNTLKANEEELNRIFIDVYGLQDELTPEVEDKDITVRKADLQRDIKNLISYAVGCMFGRYSLDVPGLAFAGGYWDASKYTSFPADKDNIIPICNDGDYFEDDVVGRFVKFIEVVYGKESLDENLKFIADALGSKGQPKDVIRNYFLNDFYADHCKIYQKRPIYWQFDSGKKNGFKCLIYMHRYQPDTVARIRTDYVHEQQGRYRTAITDLEKRMEGASTSERVKLSKQLAALQAQAAEIHDYEEKIHHLADQYISIDLDDGVKVNYAKFQDVLAKIK